MKNGNLKATRRVCEKLHEKEHGFKSASNIEFLIFLGGLLITLLAVRAFLFEPVRVDGESMLNTLYDGERCIVEKVGYWFNAPKAGDIVIVHFPERGSESFVKRVVAVGGQTIELESELEEDPATGVSKAVNYLVVDGVRVDESAYEATMLLDLPAYSPWNISFEAAGRKYVVPEGCVFVMGDHRTNSHDSRAVGPIPLSSVVGRVHGVLFPVSHFRTVH